MTQLNKESCIHAQILYKEFVQLRRAISLKVNYEKVKFSNFVFAITLVIIMNGHTCKLFENIINDVQNKGSGEINTAKHNYSKNHNLIAEGKGKFL